MLQAFSLMIWPLLACFVLVGIHAYLGLHVLARKVIFVDLALAQIAALGAVYGVLLGLSFERDALVIKLISVSFTLIGAVLCSISKKFDDKVPHEALIGIIYASALSATFLLTAHLPHGQEEVELMLTGNILWVTPKEVIYTALLYMAVGIIHWIFRQKFFSSPSPFWDFLFYASFGVVVTSSVGIGGVLLVFGYLVIPSVIGVLLAKSIKRRLLTAWSSGVLMSILGVIVSYYLDLPSGPSIVVLLALLLVAILLVQELKRARNAIRLLALAAVALIILVFSWPFLYEPKHEAHKDSDQTDLTNVDPIEWVDGQKKLLPKARELLKSPDDKIRAKIIGIIKSQGLLETASLKETLAFEKDEFIKIEIASALLSLKDTLGFEALIEVAKSPDEFAKDDAILEIRQWILSDLSDQELLKTLELQFHRLSFDELAKKYSFKK